MIPVLMITYNRLEYTRKALRALFMCHCGIFVIDNGSTDGTVNYLKEFNRFCINELILNKTNIGIAGAMNQFLELTKDYQYVGKCDNDTLLPSDFIERMLPHMAKADIVQAKHPLIKASGVGTFDEWTSKMPADGALRFSHFVGGSGILFKRQLVDKIPETDNKIMGWRQFQKEHPELRKAFATDVEIELLDEKGYQDYPEYYKQTGRV